jgi:hypothetical protein
MFKKSILLTTILLLSICSPSKAQDLYDINTVNVIELTFQESNWDYLLDQLYAAGDEERLMGTAVVNGIQFDSVGVRYKGNSSYNSRNTKNPLNIKLDYMIDDQEYENYGTLKLSNVYKDPSFVREVLAYEIARNYMPAPQSNYAKVYINGNYIGLYVNNQDVDKYFAKMHFGEKNNSFFKGELANSNPNTLTTVWGYNGIWPSGYYNYFEIESDDGWNDLINFLDVYNNDQDNMENVLNIDRHLWMLAFDNLLVNLDSPINFGHNYYVYQDNAGRFNPIIWDLNESFGVFSSLLGSSQLSTTGLKQLNPYLNESNSYYPIIKNVLSNDTYKKMYVAHMKTMIADYFSNGLYRTRALELQEFIDTEVYNDPNKFYTYANFTSNVDNSVTVSGDRPGMSSSLIGIATLMSARVSYLNALSDFTAIAPEITNISIPSDITIGDEVLFTCNVSTANKVQLCYRTSENDIFTKVDMYDDGAHQDANSADGTYGVTVTTNSSKFQYYMYAENDYAASFIPTGAEYDILELSISGKLVINEFMADNESIVTDNNDDFDDWIELYNNTGNDISLSGYYLSDDNDDLTQWAFPDITIPAYSYLIVWADNDEDNTELHANFKLSASGEAIYLVNSNEEIIDEVIFGAQTADLSMGRYENGVGNFVQMSPSFSAENIDPSSGLDDELNSLTPMEYILEPNFPNPFNPVTNISFSLPEPGEVSLSIYDMSGKLVDIIFNSENCAAGYYSYQWNAQSFSSGLYIAVLQSQTMRLTQKMILMK